MKRLLLGIAAGFAVAGVVVTACSNSTGSTLGLPVGTHDLVLVDGLPATGIARPGHPLEDGGSSLPTGYPNRYVFVTSADTNELKILNNYRPGLLTRGFMTAPNPYESLSVPVLDKPSILAVDEGVGEDGRRVTGRLVYALRAGGSELSVVDAQDDAQGLRQITRTPLPMPGPVTAFASWMGAGLADIPATTTIYFATWDGSVGSLFSLELPTTRERFAEIPAKRPTRVTDLPGEAIVSLKVMPPLAERTLDGQPFCATTACVALATRKSGGTGGRTVLFAPDTKALASLSFPAPVRDLATPLTGGRLYAVLDEQVCNASVCGGVIAVDTTTGTAAGGFPIMLDFSGRPMLPVTAGAALVRGLTVAERVVIPDGGAGYELGIRETLEADGGVALGYKLYDRLGLFTTSNADLVPFDAKAGAALDFDERRPLLSRVVLRVPGSLPDGGVAFYTEDGGANFTEQGAFITPADELLPDGGLKNDLKRVWSVAADGGDYAAQPFSVTVSDGYLLSQDIQLINQAVVPGFGGLPTTPADGTSLKFTAGQGFEARVLPGDQVLFGATVADGGVEVCGETTVVSVDAGVLQVAAVGCPGQLAYTVRAAGTKPVVILGGVEGYMGRGGQGETVTYNRRYITQPRGYDSTIGPMPALTLTLDVVPAIPGAYWTLTLIGYLSPYKATLDSSSLACSTFVPGRLVMGMIPKYVNPTTVGFPWSAMVLLPASNSIAEMPMLAAHDNGTGFVTTTDLASCYK